ncbi:hypothetical protein HELRODRAFT_169345 [Helobdella robusta]|uniref:CUB domain-containing protein n=1 Tax=Helobdella robusta TaxID=6412 RepID=T1F1T2_HELRO|nr:hypothetical protein HELRODRAFT_169345 [Helobdella robusta]ESO08489.1 hypothetical protein HELRODRAFT_169345 [Helobdella robusta]
MANKIGSSYSRYDQLSRRQQQQLNNQHEHNHLQQQSQLYGYYHRQREHQQNQHSSTSAISATSTTATSTTATIYVCSRHTLNIHCPHNDDQLVFISATLGLNNSEVAIYCGVKYNFNCDTDIHFRLNGLCSGNSFCQLPVSEKLFGNACGLHEFMLLQYRCFQKKEIINICHGEQLLKSSTSSSSSLSSSSSSSPSISSSSSLTSPPYLELSKNSYFILTTKPDLKSIMGETETFRSSLSSSSSSFFSSSVSSFLLESPSSSSSSNLLLPQPFQSSSSSSSSLASSPQRKHRDVKTTSDHKNENFRSSTKLSTNHISHNPNHLNNNINNNLNNNNHNHNNNHKNNNHNNNNHNNKSSRSNSNKNILNLNNDNILAAIISPNYPSKYTRDSHCTRTISLNPWQYIQITVPDFELDVKRSGKCFDVVEVRTSKDVLFSECGPLGKQIVLVPDFRAEVTMVTAETTMASRGFVMFYEGVSLHKFHSSSFFVRQPFLSHFPILWYLIIMHLTSLARVGR